MKPTNQPQGINLFETPDLIPANVQEIIEMYEEDFIDGNYKGLLKAFKLMEKIGYTFDYYLDGVAYDLRPIGTLGKCEVMIEQEEQNTNN